MRHKLLLLLANAVAVAAQGPAPGFGPPGGIPANATGPPPGFGPPPGIPGISSGNSTNATTGNGSILMPGAYSGPPREGDRGPALIAVSVVCTVISLLFVCLRLWRTWQIKKFRWDDGLIVSSIIFLLGTTAVNIAGVCFGQGRHIETIQPESTLFQALRMSILGQFIGAIAFSLAKGSVAMTLVQIRLGTLFNVIVLVVLVLAAIANLYNGIIVLAACQTRFLFYTGKDLPCPSIIDYFPSATWLKAGTNLLLDTVYFIAPIWFLRKVKMHARDRLAVHVLLSFLLLASFFTIASAAISQSTVFGGADLTWTTVPVLCLQTAEVAASIMAACLPAIRQMYGQRFPKKWRFWSNADSSQASSKPGGSSGPRQGADANRPGVRKTTTLISTTEYETGDSMQSGAFSPSPLRKELDKNYSSPSLNMQPRNEANMAKSYHSMWPSKRQMADDYEMINISRDGRSSEDDIEKGAPRGDSVYELENSPSAARPLAELHDHGSARSPQTVSPLVPDGSIGKSPTERQNHRASPMTPTSNVETRQQRNVSPIADRQYHEGSRFSPGRHSPVSVASNWTGRSVLI